MATTSLSRTPGSTPTHHLRTLGTQPSIPLSPASCKTAFHYSILLCQLTILDALPRRMFDQQMTFPPSNKRREGGGKRPGDVVRRRSVSTLRSLGTILTSNYRVFSAGEGDDDCRYCSEYPYLYLLFLGSSL